MAEDPLLDWSRAGVRLRGYADPPERQTRAMPKFWCVGSKRRGGRPQRGVERVTFLATHKAPGSPGDCTAAYMNRPHDREPDTCTWIVENADIEHWERGPRTFAFAAPERTHDLLQVGRDIAADLHRRLGAANDAPAHVVLHRHQGRHHLHIAIDGMVPVYKLERAVDAALERRQERDRAYHREHHERARPSDRDRELEAALDRLFADLERAPERDDGRGR